MNVVRCDGQVIRTNLSLFPEYHDSVGVPAPLNLETHLRAYSAILSLVLYSPMQSIIVCNEYIKLENYAYESRLYSLSGEARSGRSSSGRALYFLTIRDVRAPPPNSTTSSTISYPPILGIKMIQT